ncbi:MAG: RNA-binding protein [Akkermansiaceae bacterium]|nr:RNA-binding protein [Akkermansiaceae bacterium]
METPRLYLGNLSYDATEHDLEDLFKGVGSVRSVEIIYNRQTHRSKGYGFIEMLHVDEAKRAVEVLHDQPFMGRNLVVNGATNKPVNDDQLQGDNRAQKEAKAQAEEQPASDESTQDKPSTETPAPTAE